MKHLRSFGEMAVVAIHEGKKMRSNLDNGGKHACLLDMQMFMLEMYTGKTQEYHCELRCKVTESNVETSQRETGLCKKTSGTFSGGRREAEAGRK